jgi:voltage-gated potassium channel
VSDIPRSGARRADPQEPALSAWEQRSDLPMSVLAFVFLGVYAWQVLGTEKSPGLHEFLDGVMWVIWGLFAADYLVKFTLARQKLRFVGRYLFDLITVALPMVRQMRALRLITIISVLNRQVSGSIRGKIGLYVAGATLLVGTCAALSVLDAERGNPDATIKTFADALWWTLTTISTVGYGDRYPVTTEGRLVAGALMIGGIALLGVVTGVIASWFVEKITGAEQSIERTTREEIAEVREEIAALRELLLAQHNDLQRNGQVSDQRGSAPGPP